MDKPLKIGDVVWIAEKPLHWSSTLSRHRPMDLKYPVKGIIRGLATGAGGHSAASIKIGDTVYGFSLDYTKFYNPINDLLNEYYSTNRSEPEMAEPERQQPGCECQTSEGGGTLP